MAERAGGLAVPARAARFGPRPRLLGIVLAILALSPELKLRLRSASASFSGELDLQVAGELALWGLIGIWALIHLSRGIAGRRYRVREFGAPVLSVLVFLALILSSAATTFSVRSAARALQMAVLVAVLLIVYWESRQSETFFVEVWHSLRRVFVGVVLASMAISAGLGLWEPHIDVDGFPRYRWFAVHPITVGGLTGVASLMLFGSIVSAKVRWRHRHSYALAWLALAAFAGAIVATRSRGALGATAVAGVILLATARNRRARRMASLGLMVAPILLMAVLGTTTGSEMVGRVLTRGQTAAELRSLSQRTEIIDIALDLYDEQPVWGYGYQMPGPILSTYYPWAGHGHNIFVETIMALGTVGVVVILGLLVVSIGAFLSARLKRAPTPLDEVAPEVVSTFALVVIMGLISPGIAGSVAYEAAGVLWFAVFADVYLRHTRRAITRRRSENGLQRASRPSA